MVGRTVNEPKRKIYYRAPFERTVLKKPDILQLKSMPLISYKLVKPLYINKDPTVCIVYIQSNKVIEIQKYD